MICAFFSVSSAMVSTYLFKDIGGILPLPYSFEQGRYRQKRVEWLFCFNSPIGFICFPLIFANTSSFTKYEFCFSNTSVMLCRFQVKLRLETRAVHFSLGAPKVATWDVFSTKTESGRSPRQEFRACAKRTEHISASRQSPNGVFLARAPVYSEFLMEWSAPSPNGLGMGHDEHFEHQTQEGRP
uniref:Uncharacterized protein n=1 Tax=Candidatus Kentrum sp. LPFa TaxID=2126335 RepID=A0A450VYR8_9GAMM|nr:MAG: hypothetical protein BECKLPF1236A_GA0070988_100302 [Candidatus Kentron sp. LPFa]VFK26031.1 MAG: hypothetical protein BECKLPF1236C_GA0070990_100292 [Candidatus Kentron sp. LPFa]